MTILERTQEIAQKRWNKIRNEDGWVKEDAVVYALEVMDANGCFFDPSRAEYEHLIANLI